VEKYLYISMLIVSLICLFLVDYRFKLAFFMHKKATLITVLFSVIVFVIWDLIGIQLGIFFEGNTSFLSDINIVKNLPIEEIFFLTLLCYTTLILINWMKKYVHISNR